ncbi:proprotein convertase subtilisin/kexin type 6 isoform X2 [Nematostella vectensis]|uniref:proprotein convertase subtilisin/kexin type 6 isoform X2 n=1 Tax=Nematostella vectensis TaxID=45351 RepID=UPI00138FEDFD|nr:proprotein convertase subtilisin/kexin type 6 isoform X2 [Nematostella vectensis]
MRPYLWAVLTLAFAAFSLHFTVCNSRKKLFSNTWAVQIEGGKTQADRIAKSHGYINLGPVGTLDGFYLFRHDDHPKRSRRSLEDHTDRLLREESVKWAEQQVIKRRVKRDFIPILNDPLFEEQWHLHNKKAGYEAFDHHVLPVWQMGVYGKDVVVSILDDGIEYTHDDLKENYDKLASYDFNSNDADPAPRYTWNDENRHGTRCAGEVAAQMNNSVCGVGVAPKAKVGGVRMLDGDVTDAVEAGSLSLNPQHIDIYSASWGPDDDGKTVDGPARLARKAFTDGIEKGRGGKGSIYVWASGNGGRTSDNCNCDGYTNSIYTLSISSVTEIGNSPWYSEACSSTLASAFSSGSWNNRKIVTVDVRNRCTKTHTGTSASAPLAAGILAMALEVNRNLTWRDMQHIVVRTCTMDKLNMHDVVTNGVGRLVSHTFGYGLLDATRLVKLARVWRTVPPQRVCLEVPSEKARKIPDDGALTVRTEATGCTGTANEIRYLEHVECIISLDSVKRGDISIYLTSPRGTRSTLLGKRIRDNSQNGFHDWAFMTTHSWEENPTGTWTLEIFNEKTPSSKPNMLRTWELKFYGTYENPNPASLRKQPVPACDIECEGGCTGPQADHCYHCKNYKQNRTGECVASCGASDFADDLTKQCRSCSLTCATCNGPSPNDCLSCHPPLLLHNGKCVNFCPLGWFKSVSVCKKCDASCRACAGSANQCTECAPSQKVFQSKCVMNCAPDEFFDGLRCTKCHPSCKECSKEGHLGCTKCGFRTLNGKTNKLYLSNGECKHVCPAGTFEDDVSYECHGCHPSCSSCQKTGKADDCTACASGLVRVGSPTGTCEQRCPEGHFPSNGICKSCDPGCTTCSTSDPKKCTFCAKGRFLQNYACVTADQCPAGTYANVTERICDLCYGTCAECTGAADHMCTACTDGYHLMGSRCVVQCPEKMFVAASGSCQQCPASCQSCYGINTTSCLSCVPPYVLHGTQCVSSCPEGSYMDRALHQCLSCHASCVTCNGTGPEECHSCRAGADLSDGSCVTNCSKGKYPDVAGSCQSCHKSCLACTGPSDRHCTECKGVKFLSPTTGACSYECSTGYYGDAASGLCLPCQSGCSACHVTGQCTACMLGLHLYNKTCVPSCPSGTYLDRDTNSCQQCGQTCQECTKTASHCITCGDNRVLSNNSCINLCPSGTFLVKGIHRCRPCHESCAECTGAGHDRCTKCNHGLVKVWSQCLASCPPSYFFNPRDMQCEPCDYYCSTCEGGNGLRNCSACVAPFILLDSYCVRECPQKGHFLNAKLRQCKKCHSSCSSCIGPSANDCITCSDPSNALIGFTCKANCTPGQFKNTATRVCENCHPTCASCSSSGPKCTSCIPGLVLSEKGGVCESECSKGRYKSGDACKPCHVSCNACRGPAKGDCLRCNPGHVYFKHTCVTECPEGTFVDDSDGADARRCRPCHAACRTCTGLSVDECTSCSKHLFLQKTSCVLQCSAAYEPDSSSMLCKPCEKSCPDSPSRPRNRSVQNFQMLRVLLASPRDSHVIGIAVTSIIVCVGLFFVVFGVLQTRSAGGLCWRRRYTILKADFQKDCSEDEMGLIENEDGTEGTA